MCVFVCAWDGTNLIYDFLYIESQLKAEFLQLREISQFKQQEATRRIIILIISNAGGLACTFILTSRFRSRLLFMKIPRDAPSNPTRGFWDTD